MSGRCALMSEDVAECYRTAGSIISRVRGEAKSKAIAGATLFELAEFVEFRIEDLGGRPAFPCNTSINDVAAHYTPYPGDKSALNVGDVVTIDMGVHVDGYIADAAATVEIGSNNFSRMISTAEEALMAGIDVVRDGVRIREISAEIERIVRSEGLTPLATLNGHSMDRYNLHSGITIPSTSNNIMTKVKAGDVIAIEPFVTNGKGHVTSGEPCIFRLHDTGKHLVKETDAEHLMREIENLYHGLPFARRWISDDDGLDNLIKSSALHSYPVLRESGGSVVVQAEHTLIVSEDGCEITTL